MKKLSPSKVGFFKLKGKTLVCIDWANVYRWQSIIGWEIPPRKLYAFLKQHRNIIEIKFYFGTDVHPKSKLFLKKMRNIGYSLVTKEVKYVPVTLDDSYFKKTVFRLRKYITSLKGLKEEDINGLFEVLNQVVKRRKCDFDVEITMDVRDLVDKIDGFVLFSGDGDYAPLLKWLLDQQKQVVVVFAPGRLGKEVNQINVDKKRKKKIYLCPATRLKFFIGGKKYPRHKVGA